MNTAPDHIQRVTVYASSSNGLAVEYYAAAARLGTVLGRAGLEIVYGGGGVGLMGAMARYFYPRFVLKKMFRKREKVYKRSCS